MGRDPRYVSLLHDFPFQWNWTAVLASPSPTAQTLEAELPATAVSQESSSTSSFGLCMRVHDFPFQWRIRGTSSSVASEVTDPTAQTSLDDMALTLVMPLTYSAEFRGTGTWLQAFPFQWRTSASPPMEPAAQMLAAETALMASSAYCFP